MSSKKTDRREFLKQGAALASGAAVGAASQSASGQLAGPETFIQGSDDMVAYGSRSRFVTSKRIPHGGRHSPDTFGLDFHIATPLQEQQQLLRRGGLGTAMEGGVRAGQEPPTTPTSGLRA